MICAELDGSEDFAYSVTKQIGTWLKGISFSDKFRRIPLLYIVVTQLKTLTYPFQVNDNSLKTDPCNITEVHIPAYKYIYIDVYYL